MNIKILNAIFVCCYCVWTILALPSKVKIGIVFDSEDNRQEIAFRYAVESVNLEASVLPQTELTGETVKLSGDDSFHASKRVCQLLETGVAGIFGPQSENTADHVQSICDAMGIPHIETRWSYKLEGSDYSINLYPHPASLGEAYRDVIKALNWKKFAILYDSNEGLIRMKSILSGSNEWDVTVRMLNDYQDWRILLKELKNAYHNHFVVDVSDEKIPLFLKNASQIGLTKNYQKFFFTSLNMHLVDLQGFGLSNTNITALRLFDPNNVEIKKHLESWRLGEYYNFGHTITHKMNKMSTEAALMYDAVHLFARALGDLEDSRRISVTPLYCESDKTWQHGESLINYMKSYRNMRGNRTSQKPSKYGPSHQFSSPGGDSNAPNYGHTSKMSPRHYEQNPYDMRMRTPLFKMNATIDSPIIPFGQVRLYGLTGPVEFDNLGFRTTFQLEITELDKEDGLKKVGIWTKDGGANYTRNFQEDFLKASAKLKGQHLRVLTALSEPYARLSPQSEKKEGNSRYEGFCVDLLEKIADSQGFTYSLKLQEDGVYGSKKSNGEWNGIIGELIKGNADVGIVDFTITLEREEAIDFTMPFMNLGISIIVKKPEKSDPELFSFMSPFSIDVWISMATAYLGVSVLLFILARMSPVEWDCPYPCIGDPEELENSFTLQNSLWFIIGTFLCQGADIAPRAVSTRIVAGIWWFFTLIMISSYTANLAAFLTVTRMESPIESAEDLAKQTKIKYGCKNGGSTYSFFKKSNISTYQKMWTAMSNARPSVFTKSNFKGVKRVQQSAGKYAFLMESSSIEHQVERHCDLMQVGGLLDSKSYGIALPAGAPITGVISTAILELREQGQLYKLKEKWWKEKGGGKCVDDEKAKKSSTAAELGLQNVGGVFVLLLGGMGISAVAAICEFIWNARELAMDDNGTFCDELSKEVKFILKCSGNTKPIRKTAPSTPDEPVFTYGYGANYNYRTEQKQ